MKKILISAFFFCSIFLLFAQNSNKTKINSNSILAYRQARIYYDEKDYGKALKYSEDAIYLKKQEIEYKVKVLEDSLGSKDAKKAGDDIDSIKKVLQERDEIECIKIIDEYIKKKGKDFFDNSISNLLNFIKNQVEYPEAQKLIGDIYKLEGEYDFAEIYYKKALDNELVLDIPDEKYEILYLLADISRLKEDYYKMEIRLLNVIGNRQQYTNNALNRAVRNTVSANNKDAINKMFQLYRTYDYYSMNAYSQLADYYFSLDELDKAFTYSALATLNGFSKTCNLLEKRNLEFSFNELKDYFVEIQNYSDIVEWGIDNNVWKNFNTFCDICLKLGYGNFARSFLEVLSIYSPEKYWQQDAVIKLDIIDGIKNPD